eukprot:3156876-Lingulodinium_polyedra.AAC.1
MAAYAPPMCERLAAAFLLEPFTPTRPAAQTGGAPPAPPPWLGVCQADLPPERGQLPAGRGCWARRTCTSGEATRGG